MTGVNIISTVFLAALSYGGMAPQGMTRFNENCPAKRLCPVLETSSKDCNPKKPGESCRNFVAAMKELCPESDCQRSFDHTDTQDYIVPAFWLCDESRRFSYLKLLSSLKTPDARELFASPLFRGVLDGESAELYLDKSLAVEKRLKKK